MAINRILTELDALLDTRLGVVSTLDNDAALRLVQNSDYFHRETDQIGPLCGLDQAVYEQAWASRDVSALQHAIMTPSVAMLRMQLLDIHRQWKVARDPNIEGVVLEVNTYPYPLSEAELAGYGAVFKEVFGSFLQIEVTHRPWTQYTPDFMMRHYTGAVLYNYRDWFHAHLDALMKKGIPRFSMVAPKIGKEVIPLEERYVDKTPYDLFVAAEAMSRHLLAFEFVDTENFCVVRLT